MRRGRTGPPPTARLTVRGGGPCRPWARAPASTPWSLLPAAWTAAVRSTACASCFSTPEEAAAAEEDVTDTESRLSSARHGSSSEFIACTTDHRVLVFLCQPVFLCQCVCALCQVSTLSSRMYVYHPASLCITLYLAHPKSLSLSQHPHINKEHPHINKAVPRPRAHTHPPTHTHTHTHTHKSAVFPHQHTLGHGHARSHVSRSLQSSLLHSSIRTCSHRSESP